ncbi:hypothetical protein C8R44DRAFT_726289 [Mycena epipterygia]|nr:hypothetical protein C8R44DRAFT_726289 [Mycena epipterygia]
MQPAFPVRASHNHEVNGTIETLRSEPTSIPPAFPVRARLVIGLLHAPKVSIRRRRISVKFNASTAYKPECTALHVCPRVSLAPESQSWYPHRSPRTHFLVLYSFPPFTEHRKPPPRLMSQTLDEVRIPIERPPDEILALVFKEAADLPLGRRESLVPLAISGVSKRWRAVALCSPEIWTTIRVSRRRSLTHAALFLQRSTSLSFRLSVDTEQGIHGLDASCILELLRPNIERCSALALCLADDELIAWNTALRGLDNLHALRLLSLTIHSYAPDELWGPPDSLFHFTAMCSGLRSLRLSTGPNMRLQEHLHPLGLTTLNVRCTWDGEFVRHICRHSRVLETLVLRDYSASVFGDGPPARLPSLTSLVLEYRDGAIAEGLVNLALFAELPNLAQLKLKNSHGPCGWYTLQPWTPRPLPNLRSLHIEDVIFHRAIDSSILRTLAAHITHLHLINVQHNTFHFYEPHTRCPRPRIIPVTCGTQLSFPAGLFQMPDICGDVCSPGELGVYMQSGGRAVDFEHDVPLHVCSDFCELHNQSPWGAPTRSSAQPYIDGFTQMVALPCDPWSENRDWMVFA